MIENELDSRASYTDYLAHGPQDERDRSRERKELKRRELQRDELIRSGIIGISIES